MTTLEHMDALGLDDPFATTAVLPEADEDPERITGGRYRLPDLIIHDTHVDAGDGKGYPSRWLETGNGSRKRGWQRVTTLVKNIGDARALDLWHQRQLIIGMVVREDLYDLACASLSGRDLKTQDPKEKAELRTILDDLSKKILAAAGADAGANTGTAFHGFTEAQDLGLMHYARRRWHGRLANYGTGLARHRLTVVPELVERRVVNLEYGVCGTLDRILWDEEADVLRIGDLKSQKAFWTWMEIAAQMAAYQLADAMWDRATLSYVEFPKVADDLAIVAWMPVDHPEEPEQVDFFNVDLEKGRRVLAKCVEVQELRREAKSTKQTWGLLRPLPNMLAVEMYARRLESVGSAGEGSALWAEIQAQGLEGNPELASLAAEVAQRFRVTA
jgi:hypothetical protein